MAAPRNSGFGLDCWLLVSATFVLKFFLWLGLGAQCCFAQVPSAVIGINYGRVAFDTIKASIAVEIMKRNGIKKVKIYNADPRVMKALMAGDFTDVMITVTNEELGGLAASRDEVTKWVDNNVAKYLHDGGLKITCVAVGNDPFRAETFDEYKDVVSSALKNVVDALKLRNLDKTVRVTVPVNADVAQGTDPPSNGSFKDEVRMREICDVLSRANSAFTVNINPFYMAKDNPTIPLDFVMFQPVVAGDYSNQLDKMYDGVVAALRKIGFPDMQVVVGEVGWPTDGHELATVQNAQRFNQACIKHLTSGTGTPSVKNKQIDAYLFSLFDEDAKSVEPGPFERHWGILDSSGTPKYNLDLTGGGGDVPLQIPYEPKFRKRQWCLAPDRVRFENLNETRDALFPQLCPKNPQNASVQSDCTSTAGNSSCSSPADPRREMSVWVNSIYQISGQKRDTCQINGRKGIITEENPSMGNCTFKLALDPSMLDNAANQLISIKHSSGMHALWTTIAFALTLSFLLLVVVN